MGKRMAIPYNPSIVDAGLNTSRLRAHYAVAVSATLVKNARVSNRGFKKSNKNSHDPKNLRCLSKMVKNFSRVCSIQPLRALTAAFASSMGLYTRRRTRCDRNRDEGEYEASDLPR
ncbi:hypothetical protein U1Q18_033683 [Sarracenia purpurea var. burkii]